VARRILKVLAVLAGGLVAVLAAGYMYISLTWPRDYSSTPIPDVRASTDPEVIARGEYVVQALGHCAACHGFASHDFKPGDPIDWNKPLAGGYSWDIPLFGHFVAANLTPDPETGIGNMTDGQVARAIRYGVDRNGHILPFMMLAVGALSDEDLTAVVSWLRSRPAVHQENSRESYGVMAKALAGSFTPRRGPFPQHVAPGPEPSIDRGRYLAQGAAACIQCHTQRNDLTFAIDGVPFAGATTPSPDGTDPAYEFVYPNLTPDPETGHITSWSEDAFVQRLRGGRVYAGSEMPWENFQRMTEADARSIYRYLRSLPPTKHLVGPPHRKAGEKPS
jgi:mono/diheme cytochrome c family protein